MPIIYHEGYSLGDGAGNNQLLKDTVGWTGKNLADNSKTISMGGASTVFSLNDNGGFSLSGSIRYLASLTPLSNLVVGEQYIASIKVVSSTNSDARLTLRDSTNQIQAFKMFGTTPGVYELPFTYQNGWYLSVICNFSATQTQSNMEIEEIMVRKADITDPTYEPYHESVEEEIEQIYADNGVLGAKNLMINEGKNETINGVAFTVNEDGSITANGTASTDAFYSIASRVSNKPLKGLKHGVEYILSGDNSPTTDSYVYVNYFVGSTLSPGGPNTDNNGERKFTIPNDKTYISYGIGVRSGKTVTNKTFYPMIRLASDPDDTYVPYAMTNRELTEKKAGLYTKGDTVQCGLSLVGHVTTGITKLELTLRGNFDNANIGNVSVGNRRVLIRGIKGYLKTDNGVELNSKLFNDYLKLDNVDIFPQYINLTISLISGGMFTNVDNNTLIDIQNMTLILS